MRIRSTGLALFAGLSIFVAACSSGGASTAPSTAATAAPPTTAPSVEASASASVAPSASAAHSDLKIGVVTDIGTLDDKNYNEYTYKGVTAAAAAIGADAPPAVVPKDQTQYTPLIQAFIDQKFNMIVTVGFNNAAATGVAAVKNPTVQFIGVDQGPICLKADGTADFTFPCPTDPKTVAAELHLDRLPGGPGRLPRRDRRRLRQQERHDRRDRRHDPLRAVRSLHPGLRARRAVGQPVDRRQDRLRHKRLLGQGVQRPGRWQEVRQSFITTNKVDVLFQVAGKTGNGVLDAACDANIYGVGVDVDQALSYPNAAKCIVTSAEKHLQLGDRRRHPGSSPQARSSPATSSSTRRPTGIGNSPGHDLAALITPDIQTKLDTALAAMMAGSLQTCPTTGCGVYTK